MNEEEKAHAMDVSDFISKEFVILDLEAQNKADALKELTHVLFKRNKNKDYETALDQLITRESIDSTGIGHGVAIPHLRWKGVRNLVCAVGRSCKGIDFVAMDRKPVHLIFLMYYPPEKQTLYLNFVGTIVRAVRKPEWFGALMHVSTVEEFLQQLFEYASQAEPRQIVAVEKGLDLSAEDFPQPHEAGVTLTMLCRLQLLEEQQREARTGKKQIQQKIDQIRSMVDTNTLTHYDRLNAARRTPAIVPIEGGVCQGCNVRLPTQVAQRVLTQKNVIHLCTNCKRIIYAV